MARKDCVYEKISLQYFAGIIDGEGSILLSRQKSTGNAWRAPTITVASTTPELLAALKATYGGVICSKKVYKEHHAPSFTWKVSGKMAVKLCGKIRNILLVPEKRWRANIIHKNYFKCTPRNGRYTPSLAMRKAEMEYDFFHPSKS